MTILDEEDCLRVMVYEGEQLFDPVDEFCVGSLAGFTTACYVSNYCNLILEFFLNDAFGINNGYNCLSR